MRRYFVAVVFEFVLIITLVMALFFKVSTDGTRRHQAYSQLADLTYSAAATDSKVLGEQLTPTITPPRPTSLINLHTVPVETVTRIPTVIPQKSEYTIAIYGDSMVDTMGERLEYLDEALKIRYPSTVFVYYNYGVGSQNVEEGYKRLSLPLNYQSRSYPALTALKPDVVIVGSFSYNPFYPFSVEKHADYLAKLLKEMQQICPKVYLLLEIAPIKNQFGQGPGGVNWEAATSYVHSTNIIALLENSLKVAESLEIPVIDAYGATRNLEDKSGDPKLVNVHDHIHPSVSGHQFMADLIARQIVLD